MNAHAHLLSLGWAGPGHALDSRPNKIYKKTGKQGLDYNPKQTNNTGVGLIKPLMISQRKDRLGIGKKDPKHEPASGSEWWLKGFETALGNVGKSDSERSGTVTPIQAQVNWQKHQGLYGFFIKGQQMEGTIGQELLKKSNKRKSDQISKDTSGTEAGQMSKPKDTTEDFARVAEFVIVRDEDEKRRKRTVKAGALEEFQQATQFFEARVSKKERKQRGLDVDSKKGRVEATILLRGASCEETKEEQQERRRKRKEAKSDRTAQGAKLLGSALPPQDQTPIQKTKIGRKGRSELVTD